MTVRGKGKIRLAQPDRTRDLQRKYLGELTKEGVGYADFYRDWGTPGYTPIVSRRPTHRR